MWPVYGSLTRRLILIARTFAAKKRMQMRSATFLVGRYKVRKENEEKKERLEKSDERKTIQKGENTGIIRRRLRLFRNIILELGLYVSLYSFLL